MKHERDSNSNGAGTSADGAEHSRQLLARTRSELEEARAEIVLLVKILAARTMGSEEPAAALPPRGKPEPPSPASRRHHKPVYRFEIDPPEHAANGEVTFKGWCFTALGEEVSGVRAQFGGRFVRASYGLERANIGGTFNGLANSRFSGFEITALIPALPVRITLQAARAGTDWETFHSFEIEPKKAPPPSQAPALMPAAVCGPPRFVGCLENPAEVVNNLSGSLFVSGWVFRDEGSIKRLFVSHDGMDDVPATFKMVRYDVAECHPYVADARISGFNAYLPIGLGFAGPVLLRVDAELEDGARAPVFLREIRVTHEPGRQHDFEHSIPCETKPPYAAWLETNTLTPALVARMKKDADRLRAAGPTISILTPTYNTPAAFLQEMIDSVVNQFYPNWELCLADDASTEPHMRTLLETAAKRDGRIKVLWRETNGHIVRATNSALEMATGDYISLLDHDDLLSPDALLHVAEAIMAQPAADLIYTDEDKMDAAGTRYDPIFKGAFSPEMSLTHNYIQHFTTIRRSLVEEIGGLRPGFEGAQDLDLYLRVIERTEPDRILHVPFVCYHWRCHAESTASHGGQKSYVFESALKAIEESLERRGLKARPFLPEFAERGNLCLYQLNWDSKLTEAGRVTIIIPTRNRGDLLKKCVASLARTVDPSHADLIIVNDRSDDPATIEYLAEIERAGVLSCRVITMEAGEDQFNFSRLVNRGVAEARTPLVLLLNNDMEAVASGWLKDMAGWMSVPGVGAVGAKLLYPGDNLIQHAGVFVGANNGLAAHCFESMDDRLMGFNFLSHAARNVSAVTAACLLTSKTLYNELGGFDEQKFAVEFNDVDFCLRLGERGKRIVYSPGASLLHHCGVSRGRGYNPDEHANFLKKYRSFRDPWFNPNLDLNSAFMAVNPRHFGHKERIKRARILVVSHNLSLAGAPLIILDYARYFAQRGNEVVVLSPEPGILSERYHEAGMQVKIEPDLHSRASESASEFQSRLLEIAKQSDLASFDLVVCNTLLSFGAVKMALLSDIPVIWHIHESAAIRDFLPVTSSVAKMTEDCLEAADRVVFQANATRRLFGKFDKGQNYLTIHGGVDVAQIDEFRRKHDKARLRAKHNIPCDHTVISVIGTTCERKGQHIFLLAIKELEKLRKKTALIFLMVGGRKSAYLDMLHSQIDKHSMQDVRIIEETGEVYDYFAASDIFVCSSLEESFPRVILEAMAFRLPIVSTKVFGVPEMISDAWEAHLVEPGSAESLATGIRRCVENPAEARSMAGNAYAKVNRLFNNATLLPAQMDLAKEVIARGKHGETKAG